MSFSLRELVMTYVKTTSGYTELETGIWWKFVLKYDECGPIYGQRFGGVSVSGQILDIPPFLGIRSGGVGGLVSNLLGDITVNNVCTFLIFV